MTIEHLDTGPSSIRDDSICESSLPPNKSSGDIVERLLDRSDHYLPDWADAAMREAAAEIERLRRESAHRLACWRDVVKKWNAAESAVAAAYENAAKIVETPCQFETRMVSGEILVSLVELQRIIHDRASAIRAAVSNKTSESGHSPSTMERD